MLRNTPEASALPQPAGLRGRPQDAEVPSGFLQQRAPGYSNGFSFPRGGQRDRSMKLSRNRNGFLRVAPRCARTRRHVGVAAARTRPARWGCCAANRRSNANRLRIHALGGCEAGRLERQAHQASKKIEVSRDERVPTRSDLPESVERAFHPDEARRPVEVVLRVPHSRDHSISRKRLPSPSRSPRLAHEVCAPRGGRKPPPSCVRWHPRRSHHGTPARTTPRSRAEALGVLRSKVTHVHLGRSRPRAVCSPSDSMHECAR